MDLQHRLNGLLEKINLMFSVNPGNTNALAHSYLDRVVDLMNSLAMSQNAEEEESLIAELNEIEEEVSNVAPGPWMDFTTLSGAKLTVNHLWERKISLTQRCSSMGLTDLVDGLNFVLSVLNNVNLTTEIEPLRESPLTINLVRSLLSWCNHKMNEIEREFMNHLEKSDDDDNDNDD